VGKEEIVFNLFLRVYAALMKLLPTGKPKPKKPEDGCRGCCHQLHRKLVFLHPECEAEYLAHVKEFQIKHAGKLRYRRICVVCDKSLRKKTKKIRLCKECKLRQAKA
jgi:hypothetical protein